MRGLRRHGAGSRVCRDGRIDQIESVNLVRAGRLRWLLMRARRWWWGRYGALDILRSLLGAFRRQPKGPPPPPSASQLDEYGFPLAWRREPVRQRLLEDTAEHWALFADWCETRGLRAFPASVETVLRFLREAPVQGRRLYETWQAINARHEAHYWHTNANPVLLLEFGHGVLVETDGSVEIPEQFA